MTKDDIFARIVEILHETFDIEPARITPESRLGEDIDIATHLAEDGAQALAARRLNDELARHLGAESPHAAA